MSTTVSSNPLLSEWKTPYGLPPFDLIKPEHFKPAIDEGRARHLKEIDVIAGNAEAPTFENTIVPFDRSGTLLEAIQFCFENLCSSETSDALQEAEREIAPQLAAHASAVFLNPKLFARIDELYNKRGSLGLNAEQLRLIERLHLDFVMQGALLKPEQKTRYAQVTEKIAELTTLFGQKVLADEAAYQLELKGEADLAGLPDFLRDAAASSAKERGKENSHVITLSRSMMEPFLSFSSRRDLRELTWRAWTSRGERLAEHDTRAIIVEIVKLRLEQAQLHGYKSFAEYALRDRMAAKPDAVADLLQKVWGPARTRALQEKKDLEAFAASHGEKIELQAWDWYYYTEKLRAERYDLDDAEIKPYFQLERMIEAMFDCAGKLFGLGFVEKKGIPLYHPDARVWEVHETESGKLKGIFIGDNYARPTKGSGAWMSIFREQTRNTASGGEIIPIIINNNNFNKPLPGEPTLLSFDDVETLFHEFGHGLHGLLSNVTYARLAGTNVLTDFVELPSQLYEHWALEDSVLKKHALHVETGKAIPDSIVAKIKASRTFNKGFETVQYLGPALIDMALHEKSDVSGFDVNAFEKEMCAKLGVPSVVGLRHRLPHFSHLFNGDDYAAGYYVYMWAEVLEADGFEAFVEAGNPFDPATAERLKKYIYSAGNSQDPAAAYRAFRGRDPKVQPLLAQRGLA